MNPIVTVTLNPAIDGAAEAEKIHPVRKIRTSNERYDPGGGGINVARVIHELRGTALAVYLSGGVTGPILDDLVARTGIARHRLAIEDDTRISHVVYERSSKLEYRFVPEGPTIKEEEWLAALQAVEGIACDYLVASGSLPPGVPDDFYAMVADLAARKGVKLVLDTSGPALRSALDRGVFLVKPSLGEFEALIGRKLADPSEQEAAARQLVRSGAAALVAVTMGRDGALLVGDGITRRLRSPDVEAKSAVGAGDSFVAAMTLALAQGRSAEDAFAYGVAAGTAAVLSIGTGLCKREDVERLYGEMTRGR